ncbi:MAG: serine/threonine-protein kinase RsbW, partial [Blastocatellia bacterium]|nr:serine/threonine-protein kinase RsbW [Blastocatellia bacterium]
DELLGGHIHRHFNRILEAAASNPQTKKSLLKMLFESAGGDAHKSSLWAWKKRLGVDAAEFERLVDALHVHELVNSSAAFIEVNTDSYMWTDYLRAHYRLEVSGERRAPVVATTLLESLKRAPQAMARKYRREAALGLRELIADFNCQRVPASLFHYERFASVHKGEDTETVNAALDAESDLIRLPQIVHAAGCNAYSTSISCDGERCAVGHGFEAADYTDENQVVWLAAEIDSKLEASRELTAEWCDRLANLARESGFERVRLWLVAPEGFSPEASELLNTREAYGSSRQQVELLTARITSAGKEEEQSQPNEYEMVIPMGADTELIAAHTVEQIARRLNFGSEAINQIKTALIEACINAAEHSLSPDRKIYQRFRIDKDKLVVTVASRGIVPVGVAGRNGQQGDAKEEKEDGRRGWGLKLIQTLMDEVEFERVDDGTQLRMTKYFRK